MSSHSSPQPSQRLPVNPRRHKVPATQRKRVAKACNACNVRRIKCSGGQPCTQCSRGSRTCEYPVASTANVTRNQPGPTHTNVCRRCSLLEKVLERAVPDASERDHLLAWAANSLTPGAADTDQVDTHKKSEDWPNLSPRADKEIEESTEGRLLHDPDGTARYLGETSGATFLDYLKEFMTMLFPLAFNPHADDGADFLESLGQYQTHDSRPLHEPDYVDPLWFPERSEMDRMLYDARNLILDGNGSFPSGGISFWYAGPGYVYDQHPANNNSMAGSELSQVDRNRHLAFFNAAFAMVCHVRERRHPPATESLMSGEAFFTRAKLLIGNPLETRHYSISDISAMVLMAFYLLEMNRRDAAGTYVTIAIHVSTTYGLFRGWVDERGKRVFWTLYILDQWLSCIMGRPPSIMDDAIRLELPMDALSLPPAAGLKAHVELSRISGYIICNAYGIAPPSLTPAAPQYHVEKAMEKLESWQAGLPSELRIQAVPGSQNDDATNDVLSDDLAVCELHMQYHQLVVLTARPILFVAVKKAVAERFVAQQNQQEPSPWSIEGHPQHRVIDAGLKSARWNLRIAQWLVHLKKDMRNFLHWELHDVFNATIILLLDALVIPLSSNPRSLGDACADVDFAISLFEVNAATGSCFSTDCWRVLRNFRALVRRLSAALAWNGQNNGIARSGPHGQEKLGNEASNLQELPYEVGMWPPNNHGGQSTALAPGQGEDAMGTNMDEDGSLYQELVNWIKTDDLQLYSSYFM